jgi:hypothetical protein
LFTTTNLINSGKFGFNLCSHSGFGDDDHIHSVLFNQKQSLHSDELDGDDTYLVDNFNQVEIHRQMLKNLQQIEWRRLHVEFLLESNSQIVSKSAHALVINKQTSMSKLLSRENVPAVECCLLVSRVLLIDHANV